jgi:hypothetical protein
MPRWCIALLGVLLLAGGDVDAATLSGYVRAAEGGEELPLAVVALPDLKLGAVANDRGYFAVRNVPAGRHVVAVDLIGYRAWRDTVDVPAAGDVRIDPRLVMQAIDIDEVVVTADSTLRAERERTVQPGFVQLPARRLQSLPAAGESDLLRSLQLLPGIQSASDISSGLYVRGSGPDQTQIFLDEIPLYNPSHAFGFFSTFQPDAVRDVQLYKGAYPASYGGNLGAVLDVAQKDGSLDSLRVTGGASLIAARLLLEGPVGEGSWMAAGRRTYLDPVLSALRSAGTDVPDYYFYDLNTRLTQPVGDADNVAVSTYFGRDDLFFDLDAGTYFDVRWGNRAGSVRWTRLFTPALFGELTVYASQYESATRLSFFETPVEFSNRIDDLTLRGDVEFFATSDNSLTAGFRLTHYDVRFAQSFNQVDQLSLREQPTLYEAYVQDDARLPTGTNLRAGVRVARFSEGDRVAIMPRLSISQPLTAALRWKAGAGLYRQYMQLVTTEGFSGGDFWVPLDGTVPEGRSRQWTTGLEWEPSRRYKVSAETYYTDLDGLVVIDNDASVDRSTSTSDEIFVSGGQGYATGLELFAERRTGRLTGWIGYTLGKTRRTFAEVNEGRSFPPKYDRRHDLSVVASWRVGAWKLGSSFVYATGQAFTPASARYTLRDPATGVPEDRVLAASRNSGRLLPYHRLDVSARRDFTLFGAQATGYLQIINLYSRRNEWFVQYDTDDPETDPEVVLQLPILPTFGLEFSF